MTFLFRRAIGGQTVDQRLPKSKHVATIVSMNTEVRQALLVPCSRSEKLCLIAMCAYVSKTNWLAVEINYLTGIHTKTIHASMRALNVLGVVQFSGTTEDNANLYSVDLDALKRVAKTYAFNQPAELKAFLG